MGTLAAGGCLALRSLEDQRRRALNADGSGGGLIAGDLAGQGLIALVRFPRGQVQARDLVSQAGEIRGSHVPRVLLPLLVVEELGELPELVLLAGGESRDLLGVEHAGIRAVAGGGTERLVDHLHLALADLVLDQLREAALERERLADRALVIAEIGHRDRRLWVPEAGAGLRDAGEQVVHAGHGGVRLRAGLEATLVAAAVDQDQHGHDDHRAEHDAADGPHAAVATGALCACSLFGESAGACLFLLLGSRSHLRAGRPWRVAVRIARDFRAQRGSQKSS